ncbi:MAG: ABC transporter permease [Myxococcales bacterium]|nr:ABC transporter permease [Myxococcales bacterium]
MRRLWDGHGPPRHDAHGDAHDPRRDLISAAAARERMKLLRSWVSYAVYAITLAGFAFAVGRGRPAYLAALVVPIAFPLLAVRGHARWQQSRAKAWLWWLGIAVGLAIPALVYVIAGWPAPERVAVTSYEIFHEAVRAVALLAAVVYVLYTLLALVPTGLGALQKGSFVPFVSARMLSATKSGFLTVISVLSVLGVAVSSCALCSVTSIMGGFGHDLKRKILGNSAHVVVDVPDARDFVDYEAALAAVRRAVEPIGGAATPMVTGDAMASSATNTAGLLMRGIEPESVVKVMNLAENIEIGKLEYLVSPERLVTIPTGELIGRGPDGEPYFKAPPYEFLGGAGEFFLAAERKVYPALIIGRELAKSLHVMVGDELTVLAPMGELGPMGIMPRARKFRIAAIFYSGMYEYDASHAYALMPVAQKFFDLEARISKIDIRIPEPENVVSVRPVIDAAVAALDRERRQAAPEAKPLRVRDWKEMNKNLFSALKLERVATFIILSIAITVASFCIICTLLLMVTEKSREIAVLKALGAPDSAIMRVFMLEGVLIGGIGTALGVAFALAVCLGLEWSGVRLDPDVYYIDRLPINVDPHDYLVVALAALGICTLSTVYPALTAARVRPVDGLRYE